MQQLITRKGIFRCKLTGDPIVLDYTNASGEQKDHARILLWQTEVMSMRDSDFFNRDVGNRHDAAKVDITHPILVVDHDYPEGVLREAGMTLGITFAFYKLLISSKAL